MATIDYRTELGAIDIPASAHTMQGFRDWTYSEEFPQQGRISFIRGRLILDMSPERYETHVKVKAVITRVLANLVVERDLGDFYPDGGRLINDRGAVSNEPDALFASWATLESGRLAPPADRPGGKHVDLVGTPDWVCEVVSDSSEEKDRISLRHSYHEAGIPEYWLVDARDEGEEIDFELLVRHPAAYEHAEQVKGWQFSPVFARWFKFTRQLDRLGRWKYDLKMVTAPV